MFVEIKEVASRWKAVKKHILIAKCDQCIVDGIETIFEDHYKKRYLELHFCSHECTTKAQKKGGILDLEKRKIFLKNYNVENPSQSPAIKSKIDYKKAALKGHETKKKNGTYGRLVSKQELKFFEQLISIYGKDDIEHLVFINNHFVDFYCKSKNLYIELDGIYWHGLDRPIEEIKIDADAGRCHAKSAFNWYLRDRQQDSWFSTHSLYLVRITDIELELCDDNVIKIKNLVEAKMNHNFTPRNAIMTDDFIPRKVEDGKT